MNLKQLHTMKKFFVKKKIKEWTWKRTHELLKLKSILLMLLTISILSTDLVHLFNAVPASDK